MPRQSRNGVYEALQWYARAFVEGHGGWCTVGGEEGPTTLPFVLVVEVVLVV